MNLAKVKGISGLQKDLRTGAVVSNDMEALEAARRRSSDANTIQNLILRIEQLESAVNRLQQEKSNGNNSA